MKKEIKSEVSIRKAGNGYLIKVVDQLTKNLLAVTREELEKIVLYGQIVLNENEPAIPPPEINLNKEYEGNLRTK